MVKNKKYYTVWKGINTGVFDNWEDCKKQITNFEGALYKSFITNEEAEEAYNDLPENYIKRSKKVETFQEKKFNDDYDLNSISVDAACSGNPGLMEYQGVYTQTKEKIFKQGPFKQGTNNIGEFLAIVHALALLHKEKKTMAIYTDSITAISWVRKKKCGTKLAQNNENKELFDLIGRAEKWLSNNVYDTKIYKWDTKRWGEIPADFGRK